MKKQYKIFSTIIIILIALIIMLAFWQKDNISALINGLNSSSEDLAQKMDENRANLKAEIEKYTAEPIIDITAEDEQKLLKGEVTVENIADKYNLPIDYMKDTDEEFNDEHTKSFQGTKDSSIEGSTSPIKSNTKKIDEVIGSSVSKMYALKAKYVNKLGELEREVVKEYTSLPKEQQNKNSKYEILMDNLNYVAQLEKKCDDEVAKVLANLELELKEHNSDTEIIQILKDAYKQEKEIKKSYYLSIYNN